MKRDIKHYRDWCEQYKKEITELKTSRQFWRAKAIQLEKYIDEHYVDDNFENL